MEEGYRGHDKESHVSVYECNVPYTDNTMDIPANTNTPDVCGEGD
jgi:hypothetical protein